MSRTTSARGVHDEMRGWGREARTDDRANVVFVDIPLTSCSIENGPLLHQSKMVL